MTCKQCGMKIVKNQREATAQDMGYCCEGCESVHEAIRAMDERAAVEGK